MWAHNCLRDLRLFIDVAPHNIDIMQIFVILAYNCINLTLNLIFPNLTKRQLRAFQIESWEMCHASEEA